MFGVDVASKNKKKKREGMLISSCAALFFCFKFGLSNFHLKKNLLFSFLIFFIYLKKKYWRN